MEYIFGTQGNREILKTKGNSHTNLHGFQTTIQERSHETITDKYRIIRKIKSTEDIAGNCYDWYEIDRHYREVDRSKPLQEANAKNAANIDYLSMMAGIELPEEVEDYDEEQEV